MSCWVWACHELYALRTGTLRMLFMPRRSISLLLFDAIAISIHVVMARCNPGDVRPLAAWRSLRRSSTSSFQLLHAARCLPPRISRAAARMRRAFSTSARACSTQELRARRRSKSSIDAAALCSFMSFSAFSLTALVHARSPLRIAGVMKARAARMSIFHSTVASCQVSQAARRPAPAHS